VVWGDCCGGVGRGGVLIGRAAECRSLEARCSCTLSSHFGLDLGTLLLLVQLLHIPCCPLPQSCLAPPAAPAPVTASSGNEVPSNMNFVKATSTCLYIWKTMIRQRWRAYAGRCTITIMNAHGSRRGSCIDSFVAAVLAVHHRSHHASSREGSSRFFPGSPRVGIGTRGFCRRCK